MEFRFFGRQPELECLERVWNSKKAEFLILTGRRGVGKTTLLAEWMRRYGPHALSWAAPVASPAAQLRAFSQVFYNFLHPETLATTEFTYSSWEQAFKELASQAQNQRLALLIDDFPVLLKGNPGLASKVQIVWDHQISHSNLLLCLAGSDRRIMMREVLSYQAPLYGRASALIDLKPFSFGQTHSFFPDQSMINRMAIYAITGGLPAVWSRFNSLKIIPEMIADEFFNPGSPSREDLLRLLKDFRTRPGKFDAVLGALAHGAQTPDAISRFTGLSNPRKYLRLLIDASFVERIFSLFWFRSAREKRYQLTDPALRFYFRFLAQMGSQTVLERPEQERPEIMEKLPYFIGQYTWKELCQEWLVCRGAIDQISAVPGVVGSAWDDHVKVDVAGINTREKIIFLGECSWDTAPVDQKAMVDLVTTKAPRLIPPNGNWRVIFLGFARSGWTSQALAYRDEINRHPPTGSNWSTIEMHLLDLDQVDQGLDETINRRQDLPGEIVF